VDAEFKGLKAAVRHRRTRHRGVLPTIRDELHRHRLHARPRKECVADLYVLCDCEFPGNQQDKYYY
jgi:hypothetical protein